MSNKQQLQTNNTKYASLIETLRGKAAGGEDVTTETNAYTEKITQLESAVTTLETELAGKASGGSIEYGTFTVNGVGYVFSKEVDYVFPFVIGMTWREWMNSPLNMTLPLENMGAHAFEELDSHPSHMMGSGMRAYVSIDSMSGVSLDDEIIDGCNYYTAFGGGNGGY